MSASRPGKSKASGVRSLAPWSSSTAASSTSSGSGKRSTAARALRHWAAAVTAKTDGSGQTGFKIDIWSMTLCAAGHRHQWRQPTRQWSVPRLVVISPSSGRLRSSISALTKATTSTTCANSSSGKAMSRTSNASAGVVSRWQTRSRARRNAVPRDAGCERPYLVYMGILRDEWEVRRQKPTLVIQV